MKKMLIILPLVLLFCITFSCQQYEEAVEEPVADIEADKAAIMKIPAEFNSAYNAADIDRLLSIFTEDAVRIPPNEPALIGKEAIRGLFQQQFDRSTAMNNSELVDFKISGDLAFFRGIWTSVTTPKDSGEPIDLNGSFISIVQKQSDGSWKTICNIWSNEQLIAPWEEN